MICLDRNDRKLQAFLGGAAATTNPTVTVIFHDVIQQSKTDTSEYRRGDQFTVLAGATETDILAAPAQGTIRDLDTLELYNADTASVTVTVCIDDNTTNRILVKVTLGVASTLHYEHKKGWYVTDSNGSIVTSISQIPMSPLFLAYNSADDTNQTGNGAVPTVDFDTEVFDVTSNFAADTFTAPITGKYLFAFGVNISAIPAGCTTGTWQLLTSNRAYQINETFVAATWTVKNFALSCVADMDAADTAIVRVSLSGGAGDTATIEGSSVLNTFFSGVRVG